MSLSILANLPIPRLGFAELWHVTTFLTLHELYTFGLADSHAFIVFMRERSYRIGRGGSDALFADLNHFRREYLLKLHASLGLPPPSHTDSLTDELSSLSLRSPKKPSWQSRFLSKYSSHNRCVLVSYPRSGNSFVRRGIELRTGIVTGSDSRPNLHLPSKLLEYGYLGEGVVDSSVWVVKSHFPERLGYMAYNTNRVVLVVRNPFDSLESYYHMGMTNTHDRSMTDSAFDRTKEIWDAYLESEIKVWCDFHIFWLRKVLDVPIMFVRYEDLLADEHTWMERIMNFMKEDTSLPVGLHRYFPKDNTDKQSAPGYKPKSLKIGKALRRMTVGQARKVALQALDMMELFGYELRPIDKTATECSHEDNANEHLEVHIRECPFLSSWLVQESQRVKTALKINIPEDGVRSKNDRFGRQFYVERYKYTKNDTQPLEVV